MSVLEPDQLTGTTEIAASLAVNARTLEGKQDHIGKHDITILAQGVQGDTITKLGPNLAKQIVLCICFVAVALFPRLPTMAEAWSVSGHQIIVSRASRLFPGPWGDFFCHYEWLLNETIAYPDTFYKGRDPAESARHYINLEVWSPNRPETGTLPFAVEGYGRSMSEAIKIGDWNRVLLDAGRLAHYISDISQPYHSTINYNPVAKSGENLHVVWDGAISRYLSEIKISSSIETPQIVNFTKYALSLARQSNSFLTEINATLIDLGLPWSNRMTEIVENRTNTAIIATINVWHTAISASNATPPAGPKTKTLRIVAKSTLQEIDVSRDSVFEFEVTDLLGVRTASQVRAEVASIVLDVESRRDLTDPLGYYRALLSGNKLKQLEEIVEITVTAIREGYASDRLVLSIRLVGQQKSQVNHMIYVSALAGFVMLLSFVLLVREYRRERPMSDS